VTRLAIGDSFPMKNRCAMSSLVGFPYPPVVRLRLFPVVELIATPLASWASSRSSCWKPPAMSIRVLPTRIFPQSGFLGSVLTLTPGTCEASPSIVDTVPASWIPDRRACFRANGCRRA